MARHFTVDEATAHLRSVEPVLRDAVRLKREYDKASSVAATVGRADTAHGAEPVDNESKLSTLHDAIVERIRFITGLGIQIKDLDSGLIDFPTVRQGNEVLLCWRLGEPAILWWHTYEDGFPGRRPV